MTPAPSDTPALSFVFKQSSTNFKSGTLRFVLGGLTAGATGRVPIGPIMFNSANFTGPATVSIRSTAMTPFVSGLTIPM